MTLVEAIEIRRSRRKYVSMDIDQKAVEKLQKLIDEYNKITGFSIGLVLNNGEAFNKITKTYGMFSGVNHYIGLISDSNDPNSAEKIGYYGELLILHATTLGLGTCWVGGAFDKESMPFKLANNEQIQCAIIIGNTQDTLSFREKLMHGVTHRKIKSATDMYTSDAPVPDWFESGMQAVTKAPSAVNSQPVTFTYIAGKVTAEVKGAQAVDLGIAKLHFELGAGGGTWKWGNSTEFVKKYNA